MSAIVESDEVRLARLGDEAEIGRVLNRYCHAVDRGDVELLRSIYHPDGIDEHGAWFHGLGSAFADWVAGQRDQWSMMMHHLTSMLIEVHGDVAAAQSYVIAVHEDAAGRFSWGCGRYLDQFERRDGEWRIAYRRYVHDTDLPVPADPLDVPPIGTYVTGLRSTDDPSYALFSAVAEGRAWPGETDRPPTR